MGMDPMQARNIVAFFELLHAMPCVQGDVWGLGFRLQGGSLSLALLLQACP